MAKAQVRQLRQRITFQTLTLTDDGQGGSVESWANIADIPTVWAEVKPTKASEQYFAQAIRPVGTHQIIIRWRADLSSKMRILHAGRVFQIHGIRAENEEHWFTLIDAEENVGT